MSVKISDLLSLDLLKNAKIIAGKNGLNNEIKRVTFNDCPLDLDVSSNIIRSGDLYINSFYIVKDNKEQLINFFKYYIENKSAGIFILDEFFKEFPQEVISLANTHNYPIILIDNDTPYAEIINATIGMILFDQYDIIAEMKINKILDSRITPEEIIETIEYFNIDLKKCYSSVFIKIHEDFSKKEKLIRSDLENIYNINSYKYKNGLLAFLSYNNNNKLELLISQICSLLIKYNVNYKIGVSNSFINIMDFNICINQSISAYNLHDIYDTNIIYYNSLNIYKILYPMKDKQYLRDYVKEILEPLNDYDVVHKLDLLKTVENYIKNDGNYKKTGLDMAQHENTIRYRISIAKKILDLENNHFSFIEQVSVALKINRILNKKGLY